MNSPSPRPARRWRFLWLSLLLGWGASAAYFYGVAPVYQAKTVVKAANLNRAVEALHDPELSRAAVRRLLAKEGSAPHDAEVFEPSRTLTGKLELQPFPSEGTLEISYRTTARAHAVEELTALAEAFLERLRSTAVPADTGQLRNLEHEQARLDSEHELQRSTLAELEEKLRAEALDETARTVTLERVKAMSRVLAEARLARLVAEEQLVQIRRALEARLSFDLMLAHLAEGSAKEFVRLAANQVKLAAELDRQKQARAELSAIYGRRHPQLLKLQEQIDSLSRRITSAAAADGPAAVETAQRAWLETALDEQLAQSRLKEQDLQEQLELEQSVLGEQSGLEQERTAVQSRLATLEQARQEVAERLVAARSAPQAVAPAIVQHPWLAPDPVSLSLAELLLLGTGAGLALGLIAAGLGGASPAQPRSRTSAAALRNAVAERKATLQERRQLRLARLQQSRA